jgi:formylglycine-generating enzyme required for sulfatase activity
LNVPPLPAPRFACPSGSVAIRGGSFDMGDDAGDMGHLRHRVTVSPYCLDTTEVTVAAFRTFWNANHPAPTGPVAYPRAALPWTDRVTAPLARNATDNARFTWSDAPGDREDHPINGVDWHTMQAFCVWKGGRLPTEAEWEFAARGTDRRAFPWGDEAPTGLQLNACGDECRDTFHGAWRAMSGFGRDPFSATAPVGRFTKTRPEGVFFDDDPDAGLFDLSGNVWEWTADAESPHRDAGATTDATDPLQTEGELRVSRGGAWDDSVAAWVRATSRSAAAPNHRFDNRGARCAYAPRSPSQ